MQSRGLYFQREWRLTLKRNNVTYLTYTSMGVNLNEFTPHRLVFSCYPYSNQGAAPSLQVSIYNMSIFEANLVQQNDDIFLEAGYVERGAGVLFEGKIQAFNGTRVQEGIDFNYVFTVYSLGYFGLGGFYTANTQAKPQYIDLSQYQVPSPFTIANQALAIGQQYGFQPGEGQIQPSLLTKVATNISVSGGNMYLLLSDFTTKTGYEISFDTVTKTYSLRDANPNNKTYAEFANTVTPIIIDNNSGLIGYPAFDPTKQTIELSRMMDNNLRISSSTMNVDLSNTQLVNFKNGTTQDLIDSYRQYKSFVVYTFSYYGDTRGTENDWYQKVIGWGLN